MSCPFPNGSQVLTTRLRSQLESPSSSSTPPSSKAATPSFTPNAPSYELPPEYVTIQAVLASLSNHKRRKSGKAPTLDDVELPPDLDWTLPVSKLLRIGTARAHIKAEHSDGADALVKGHLRLEEYIRWLAVLWRVYSALELGLSEQADNPILSPTYNPEVLARAPALARDISYLLSLIPDLPKPKQILKPPEDAPLPPFPIPDFLMPVFTITPPPLATYITHLRDLAGSIDTAPLLLAHSYVRYLGDLSGGQHIATRTKKAFDLTGPEGLEFYHFEMDGVHGPMSGGKIKEWFRQGMDHGVADSVELKEDLVKEANLAFALNTHLFSLIRLQTHKVTTAAAGSPSVRVPQVDSSGRKLRYYEVQKLEREEKARVKLLTQGPPKPNTWKERIERFFIFAVSTSIALIFSRFALPWLMVNGVPTAKEVWAKGLGPGSRDLWVNQIRPGSKDLWENVVYPQGREFLRSKGLLSVEIGEREKGKIGKDSAIGGVKSLDEMQGTEGLDKGILKGVAEGYTSSIGLEDLEEADPSFFPTETEEEASSGDLDDGEILGKMTGIQDELVSEEDIVSGDNEEIQLPLDQKELEEADASYLEVDEVAEHQENVEAPIEQSAFVEEPEDLAGAPSIPDSHEPAEPVSEAEPEPEAEAVVEEIIEEVPVTVTVTETHTQTEVEEDTSTDIPVVEDPQSGIEIEEEMVGSAPEPETPAAPVPSVHQAVEQEQVIQETELAQEQEAEETDQAGIHDEL